ncbi:AhpC/TSA family protein [Chitinophaga agrisoli]|uniref:AhpC/TSA family protein n=1 Tax=Chitinophaga agrisoli TaxID=2607653 RepID=A0A5B2VK64_9BACT|nr:TlpA disulfide reductase family protein [Chitinophaga agrisoli]KAA2238980.1 AhpC/TSA family protein [Chitinophaga agrisoli]
MKTGIILMMMAVAGSMNNVQPAAAQTDKKEFVINGTLKNFAVMPAKVYLRGLLPSERKEGRARVLDSATVQAGKFHFSGTVDGIWDLQLSSYFPEVNDGPTRIRFVDMAQLHVTGGVINLTADGKFDKNTVSGEGAQAELDYREAMKEVFVLADSIRTIMQSEEAQTNPTMQLVMSNMMGDAMNAMAEGASGFLKTHPASPAAPVFMQMLIGMPNISAAADDSLLQTLPPATREYVLREAGETLEKKRAAQLKKQQDEALTTLGKPAMDFTEQDINGKQVSLSSYRGKYVLIDFWASWCAPCRAENPNVVNAYQRFKDKGFEILGVSLDGGSSASAWKQAIEKDGLSWTQVSDLNGFDNAAAKLYGVTSIPQNFLVDPNGVIIAKNLRGEALHNKLAEVLK